MPQNGEREDWGNQKKYCNYKSYAVYVNVVDAPQDDSTHSYGHVRRTNKIVNFTRHTHTHTNKQIILYGEKKHNILPARENEVENLDALSSVAVA